MFTAKKMRIVSLSQYLWTWLCMCVCVCVLTSWYRPPSHGMMILLHFRQYDLKEHGKSCMATHMENLPQCEGTMTAQNPYLWEAHLHLYLSFYVSNPFPRWCFHKHPQSHQDLSHMQAQLPGTVSECSSPDHVTIEQHRWHDGIQPSHEDTITRPLRTLIYMMSNHYKNVVHFPNILIVLYTYWETK